MFDIYAIERTAGQTRSQRSVLSAGERSARMAGRLLGQTVRRELCVSHHLDGDSQLDRSSGIVTVKKSAKKCVWTVACGVRCRPLFGVALTATNMRRRCRRCCPRSSWESIDVDRSRKINFGRTARKPAPMLVPDRLTVKTTAKVCGAAASTLRIKSLEGSLMIEWE